MVNNCNNSYCGPVMFLKNIINTTVISVDQIGVVPWCIIWWFIWFIVHSFYKKCFQVLLKRISLKEDHSKQLIRLYWSIAFTSLTVPFAMQNLKLDYSDVINRFYYVLENHISKWFLTDLVPSVQMKLSYVILAGFYLNNICEVCFEFDLYSKEFIMNELIGLFFIATFPLRCVQYGLAVTTVINVVDFALSLSKLFSCFCDIAQTKSLRIISYTFLFFHFVLWFFAYFHILPSYLIYQSLKKMIQATDVRQISMFLLLNGSLLTHYVFVLATSPVTLMLFDYVWSKKMCISTGLSKEEFAKEVPDEEKEKMERIVRKRENLRMLYHTVKCVIRIKRKLAKIRQEKKAKSENSCEDHIKTNDNESEHRKWEEKNSYQSTMDDAKVSYSNTNRESLDNKCNEEQQFNAEKLKLENDFSDKEEETTDDELEAEEMVSHR